MGFAQFMALFTGPGHLYELVGHCNSNLLSLSLTTILASVLILEFEFSCLVFESWLSPLKGIWLFSSLGAPCLFLMSISYQFLFMEPD